MHTMRYLAVWFLAGTVHAGDWAHWRGPEQNGICREKNLVDRWSPKGENLLWEAPVGGRAAPIILNGRFYINCRTDHDINDPAELLHARQQVVCLDAATGKEVWKDVFAVSQTDIPAPRVGWASMAGDTETGNVYVHTVDGILRCYDKDGKVVWDRSLMEELGEITGYGGRIHTPIVDEDRVIVSIFGKNWGEFKGPPVYHLCLAFDKRTGALVWMTAPGGRPNDTNYSCPVIAVIRGQRMLIGGHMDGGVYAVNARTGKEIWTFSMSRRSLNASLVVEGDYVYASHGEDNIDNNEFGRVQCIDATGTGDVTQSKGVWRVDGIKAGYASLLSKDGVLYVVSDVGKLHAFDAKTGARLWDHDIGTVGKGSPVWADGKLYVMEVNGRIHILRPGKEKCETVSTVHVTARDGKGDDEIYASPAIANGRIYFVTRDRTFCVGRKDHEVVSDPIPPLPAETPVESDIAHLQIVPAEVSLRPGESVEYTIRAYDKNGRFIKNVAAPLQMAGLGGATIEGAKLTAGKTAAALAGTVTAKVGGVAATARLRVFPPLPWKWTFDDYNEKQVPPTWINAFMKILPVKMDGGMAMRNLPGPGKPSGSIWMGTSEMSGYTIQADVMFKELKRRLSSAGVTCQRYDFVLIGNTQKVQVQSWAAHARATQTARFRIDPNVWYTVKLRVDVANGVGHARGKAWKRGEPEPESWTIEATDPHPLTRGSPALYYYSLGEAYFDNVIVSENQ